MRPAAIAFALLALSPLPALAKPPVEAPIPVLPLSISVAPDDAGKPVQDDAWIDAQIAEAEKILGRAGLHFTKARSRALPAKFAKLETRKDRDALTGELQKGFINVFVVSSLRDVDDTRLLRMGVHWRPRNDAHKHYVIVAASAWGTTLAHELGHHFGLGHSATVDNLMSYSRTGDHVFLVSEQERAIRSFARLYLRIGEIAAAP